MLPLETTLTNLLPKVGNGEHFLYFLEPNRIHFSLKVRILNFVKLRCFRLHVLVRMLIVICLHHQVNVHSHMNVHDLVYFLSLSNHDVLNNHDVKDSACTSTKSTKRTSLLVLLCCGRGEYVGGLDNLSWSHSACMLLVSYDWTSKEKPSSSNVFDPLRERDNRPRAGDSSTGELAQPQHRVARSHSWRTRGRCHPLGFVGVG